MDNSTRVCCIAVSLYKLSYRANLQWTICNFLPFRVTYKDSVNQSVLDRLLREVKALNPEFLTQHIKGIRINNKVPYSIAIPTVGYIFTDAAYRFYRSRCEDESAKRRGKLQTKNRSKRKHERMTRVSCIIIVQYSALWGKCEHYPCVQYMVRWRDL